MTSVYLWEKGTSVTDSLKNGKKKKNGVATLQDFQRDKMEDNDVYGIYIDRSGFFEKPTIIMFESRSLANIFADWYGKEV